MSGRSAESELVVGFLGSFSDQMVELVKMSFLRIIGWLGMLALIDIYRCIL